VQTHKAEVALHLRLWDKNGGVCHKSEKRGDQIVPDASVNGCGFRWHTMAACKAWPREVKIPVKILQARLTTLGWPIDRALSEPPAYKRSRLKDVGDGAK